MLDPKKSPRVTSSHSTPLQESLPSELKNRNIHLRANPHALKSSPTSSATRRRTASVQSIAEGVMRASTRWSTSSPPPRSHQSPTYNAPSHGSGLSTRACTPMHGVLPHIPVPHPTRCAAHAETPAHSRPVVRLRLGPSHRGGLTRSESARLADPMRVCHGPALHVQMQLCTHTYPRREPPHAGAHHPARAAHLRCRPSRLLVHPKYKHKCQRHHHHLRRLPARLRHHRQHRRSRSTCMRHLATGRRTRLMHLCPATPPITTTACLSPQCPRQRRPAQQQHPSDDDSFSSSARHGGRMCAVGDRRGMRHRRGVFRSEGGGAETGFERTSAWAGCWCRYRCVGWGSWCRWRGRGHVGGRAGGGDGAGA
ncbi:hypothetical protein C8R44DRAFT_973704, partial [Mycena epipterygia]